VSIFFTSLQNAHSPLWQHWQLFWNLVSLYLSTPGTPHHLVDRPHQHTFGRYFFICRSTQSFTMVRLSHSSPGKYSGNPLSLVLFIYSKDTAQLFNKRALPTHFLPLLRHFGLQTFVFLWRNYILCSSLCATLHAYTLWWWPHTQSLLVILNPCWEHGSVWNMFHDQKL